MKLDATDRQLLALLSYDGRATNRKLASRTGMSPSACLARTRRLEKIGAILGYRAIVSTAASGARLEGWADVRLLTANTECVQLFEAAVLETNAIVAAHRVAGQYDYVLHFLSDEPNSWKSFSQRLVDLGCHHEARFSVTLESLK